MNKKTACITGIVAIFVISMGAASGSFVEVSGETGEKPTVPRYSETCAHGHNGFDCKTPKHRVDILALQEKTTELELRIAVLESQR